MSYAPSHFILTVILYIGSIIVHIYRQENRSTENSRTFPGSISNSCRTTSTASEKVNRNPADTSSRVHHKHWGLFQPHVNITKRINNHGAGAGGISLCVIRFSGLLTLLLPLNPLNLAQIRHEVNTYWWNAVSWMRRHHFLILGIILSHFSSSHQQQRA